MIKSLKYLIVVVAMVTALTALTLSAWAQSSIGNNLDHGNTLPTTCRIGQTYFLLATQGANAIGVYQCATANTWTSAGGATTGSGAPVGSCSASQLYVDTATGKLYACTAGSWVLVGAGSAPGGAAGGDLGGTYPNPTDLKTTQPTVPVIRSGFQASAGSGTSIVVTAPSSITNGDAIYIYLSPQAVVTETFTPPAGFSQIGTTTCSTGANRNCLASFCKVAASESGNYTFTLGTSSVNVEWGSMAISGSSCTTDAFNSGAANATSVSVTATSTTLANDLVVMVGSQPTTQAGIVVLSSPAGKLLGNRTRTRSYSFPNGSGNFPVTNFYAYQSGSYTGIADDFVAHVVAFPGTTSTSVATQANSTSASSALTSQHITGNLQVDGMVEANGFLMANTQCDATQASYINGFSMLRGGNPGIPLPIICWNANNNMQIDPGFGSSYVQIGQAAFGGATLLIGSGREFYITRDGLQDDPVFTTDVNDDLLFGCPSSGCAGSTEEGDIAINTQSGKSFHLMNNFQDELWVNGSGFVGGVPVAASGTPATPVVTPTCGSACSSTWGYKIFCTDANSGSTPASTEGTTALQNATLSSSNKNVITWTPTPGCKLYSIFRSTAATSPATTGVIGTLVSVPGAAAQTFTDTGLAGDSSTAPATNTTGTIAIGGTSGGIRNVLNTATMGLTLKKGTGSGNYATASTTYVVVDSTNLCFTVTIPTGWKLGVVVNGAIGTATGVAVASLALTDNAACSTANAGILVETTETTTAAAVLQPIGLSWVIAGDGASHNVALQYKTANGADSTTLANSSATLLPTMVLTLMPSN